MDCSLKQKKENIHSEIKDLLQKHFGEDIILGESSFTFKPSGKYVQHYDSIKNKNLEAIKLIEEFITNHAEYGKQFSNEWTSYDRMRNVVAFNMPNYIASYIQQGLDIKARQQTVVNQIDEEKKVIPGFEDTDSILLSPDLDGDIEQVFSVDDINPANASLNEYLKYKQNLLLKIKDSFEKFKKLNVYGTQKYKDGSKKYIDSIARLEDSLSKININDATVIYQDVINDIDYMNDLLDNFSIDDLDSTELINRIDTFSKFFKGTSKEGKSIMTKDIIFTPKEIDNFEEVVTKINDLTNKYQLKRHDVIISLLYTNPHFQKAVADNQKDANQGFNEENIEAIINDIEKLEDVDMFSQMFLGADTGGGVLGQLVLGHYSKKLKEKQGETAPLTTRLEGLYNKIKDRIDIDIFYDKDENGVSNNKLISKFTSKYIKSLYDFLSLQKEYYKATKENKAQAYSTLMRQRKDTVEYIDLSKLSFLKTQLINNPTYAEHFTHSDDVMQRYEQELKDKLGLHYEKVMKDAINKFNAYQNYVRDNTEINSFVQNPFNFINHFNSDNFNEESQPGIYPYSNYAQFIPLKSRRDINTEEEVSTGYYNDKFDIIEKDKEVYEVWDIIHSLLTEHINPVLTSMGQDPNILDLPALEDISGNEILKSKELMNKYKGAEFEYHIYSYLKKLANNYRKMFVNGTFTDLLNRDKDKISLSYYNGAKYKVKELSNMLMNKSLKELEDLARKQNINVNDIQADLDTLTSNEDKDKFIKAHKRNLALSLANKQIYEKVSTDLISNIINLTDITNNASARQESLSVARIVQEFIESKSTDNNKLANTQKFFSSWVKRNLQGDSVHADRTKKMAGVLSTKVTPLGKNLDAFEKELSKFIKNELINIDSPKDYNFNYDGKSYFKEKGEYYKIVNDVKTVVTKQEITDAYTNYLTDKLNSLGTNYTVGSIIVGTMGAIAIRSLALNFKSGIRNIIDGKFKNLIFSAGERFFTEEQHRNARTFLVGINTDKYLNSYNTHKSLSIQGKNHALQAKTFKMFSSSFSLMQDKRNQLATIEEEKTAFSKMADILMDVSIGNPEMHNQGEIMLGIYQNVIIQDNKGNEHQLFDGKEFTIYIPGTIQLKPEFKSNDETNPAYNNVTKYENFEDIEEDNNNLSTVFATIDTAIKRIQGNYSDKDIPGIQGSTPGKALLMFQRYLPEHTMANYGEKKTDLITGTQNYKGRKAFLFKHAPSAGTYLILNTAMTLGGVTGLAIAGSPLLLGMLGTYAAGTWLASLSIPFIAYFTRKHVLKKMDSEIKMNKKEFKLALDFLQETMARMIDTPLNLLTYGKNKKVLDTVAISRNMTKKYFNDTPITEKERKILSESAQELANKATAIIGVVILKAVMQAAYLAFAGDDDDDDDMKATKLKKIEKYINFVGNTGDNIVQDVDKYTNPKEFITQASTFIFLKKVEQLAGFTNMLSKAEEQGEEYDMTGVLMDSPLNIAPKAISDVILKEDVNMLGEAREYQINWWDVYAKKDSYLDDKKLRNKRKYFKEDYENQVREDILNEAELNHIELSDAEVDDEVAKIVRKRMKKSDINKEDGETSKEALDRIEKEEESED